MDGFNKRILNRMLYAYSGDGGVGDNKQRNKIYGRYEPYILFSFLGNKGCVVYEAGRMDVYLYGYDYLSITFALDKCKREGRLHDLSFIESSQSKNHVDIVKGLLEEYDITLNVAGIGKRTPKLSMFLVESNDLSINIETFVSNMTPIFYSMVTKCHRQISNVLLYKGNSNGVMSNAYDVTINIEKVAPIFLTSVLNEKSFAFFFTKKTAAALPHFGNSGDNIIYNICNNDDDDDDEDGDNNKNGNGYD